MYIYSVCIYTLRWLILVALLIWNGRKNYLNKGKSSYPQCVVCGSRSDVESGTDITRSMITDTPNSKKKILVPVSFQKLCHVVEVFLISLRLVDLDVVSRIDITRSMTRDTSSNKMFSVSFQRSSNVLEAFLASLQILVLLFKSYSITLNVQTQLNMT